MEHIEIGGIITMADEWTSLMEKLKAPISDKALSEHRDNPQNKYIPIQWYQYHLEKVTDSKYSLEIIKQHVNIEGGFVECIVRLHLGGYFRDGFGFHLFGEKSKIANSLDLAYAEAVRGIIDFYLIGWHELGIYNKYGMVEAGSVLEKCKKCSLPMTKEDLESNKQYPLLRQPYHPDCIPNHLKK
jgi:hypothetical protein